MEAPLKRADLRAHIAKVAAALFYEEGIHAVGVDRIADEAQVTKRTLYRYYASKDVLIEAALRSSPLVVFPPDGTPVDRMLGAFERLHSFLTDTRYRGCPFIFYTAELVDRTHPARRLIERRVEKRRAWFRELAVAAGASDPDSLSEQLDVLFDGALASAAKRSGLEPVIAAADVARMLVERACSTRLRASA